MFEQKIYLVLAFFGLLVSVGLVYPWLIHHHFDYQFFLEIFYANDIVKIMVLTILSVTVVLLVFIVIEGRHLGMSHLWIPIVATLILGVSFGFPLFLAMRERFFHMELGA